MSMYILPTLKCFRLAIILNLNVAGKFYFVIVFLAFLLQIRSFHNCQKHLDNKTYSHRNNFRLNLMLAQSGQKYQRYKTYSKH